MYEQEEPVYKIIHAIDPSKINVPIRERFAILTLSSNKKKQNKMEGNDGEIQNNLQPGEKRQSASRNLMDLLTASEGGGQATGSGAAATKCANPLLQSDSSSKSSSEPPRLSDETQLEDLEEQAANANQITTEHSEVMERLLMSEEDFSLLTEEDEDNDVERQIVALSQQISTLTVSSKPTTVISATPSSHEQTQVVSIDSQKMSSGEQFRSTKVAPTLKVAPPAPYDSEISIIVASSSSEEEEEDESESAITISDTTASSDVVAPDDGAAAADIPDFDALTSIILQSGETADALLPSTFSNEKADRMEAFLRDVSQEFREMAERQEVPPADATVAETTDATTEEPPQNTPKTNKEKAKDLCTADTESMSPDIEEILAKPSPTKPTEREQRLLALDDTRSMCQTIYSLVDAMPAGGWKTPRASEASNYQNNRKEENDAAMRFANDETEPNTVTSFSCDNTIGSCTSPATRDNQNSPHGESIVGSTPNNSLQHSACAAPEDSIVISETSSEEERQQSIMRTNTRTPAASRTPMQRSPTFKTPTPRTPKIQTTPIVSREIIASEEHNGSSDDSDSALQSQLSQIQMSLGSINISAKINIKIHISQQISSDEEEGELSTTSDDDDYDDETRQKPLSLPTNEENSLEKTETEVPRIVQNQKTPRKSNNPVDEVVAGTAEAAATDGAFQSHAEKLLTELYGKAWQTPDVMRTLKRTTGARRRNTPSSSPSVVAAKESAPAAETPKTTQNNRKATTTLTAVEVVEESLLLDDFSMFQRNIVKTNLESTRLWTPKKQTGAKADAKPAITISTEPKRQATAAQKALTEAKSVFKVPPTEVKRPPPQRMLTTRNGRVVKPRWQKLIDSDSGGSSGANASDDSDADRTGASPVKSDSSWKQQQKQQHSEDSEASVDAIEKPKKITRTKRRTKTTAMGGKTGDQSKKEDIIYLDLSQEEVSVVEGTPRSPPANHDETFSKRLHEILRTCRPEEKPKLEATPKTTKKPKRKLFTAQFNYDDNDENLEPTLLPSQSETPKHKTAAYSEDVEDVVHIRTPIQNKPLEAIKIGKPIFKPTPPRTNTKTKQTASETPKIIKNHANLIKDLQTTEFSFLKSLEPHLCKSRLHPEALVYRENYRLKKEELAGKLYQLFNEKIFENRLNVPMIWNKKLINTAGRCLNRKKMSVRSCTVELSEKVLSSAERLRCTLVHELCHAATWIFSGEGGHGATWKEWARKANSIFPELPKIGRCHNYEIEYKYTYKCTLCAAKSHAHSKSKKVENIRCSYCHGSIEIFLNKKDKDGNIIPTPVREPTGFAKFVKDNYKQYKRDELKHADVMKLLSSEFAALKVIGTAN